ncbi:four helix bundle protein [Leucothrix arctica]|nr:four helix bundle protein [Leucothrix arctica]
MNKFHQLPQVIQDTHKVIEWFIPQIEKLPRSRKFCQPQQEQS